jgi:hypothetical protein
VTKEKKLWKELHVVQSKMELLTLQTANGWENMAIENETKATMYDELVKLSPKKEDLQILLI